jgi:hypothetical protein
LFIPSRKSSIAAHIPYIYAAIGGSKPAHSLSNCYVMLCGIDQVLVVGKENANLKGMY